MSKFKLQIEGDLSDIAEIGSQLLERSRQMQEERRARRAAKADRAMELQQAAIQLLSTLAANWLKESERPAQYSEPITPSPEPTVSTVSWDVEEEQETPSTMDPLHTDPVYGAQQTAQGPHAGTGESNPDPGYREDMNIPRGFDFASMKPDPEAWIAFSDLVKLWLQGFNCPLDEKGMPTEPQPDRLTALKSLGEGRWPLHILRYCANYGSLQRAVFQVIHERNWPWEKDLPNSMITPDEEDIALAELVAANIVQVAHAAFPDIIGFYDHSTRWKRNLKKEGERE